MCKNLVEFIGVLAKHLTCKSHQHLFVGADDNLLSIELEPPYRFAREVFAKHFVFDHAASRDAVSLAVRRRQLLKASVPLLIFPLHFSGDRAKNAEHVPVADGCGLLNGAPNLALKFP